MKTEFVERIGRDNILPHVQDALKRAPQIFEDSPGLARKWRTTWRQQGDVTVHTNA